MKKPRLDVTNVSSYQTSLYCQSFLNILLHISWCSTWHPPTFFCHCSWDFGQVIWLKLQSCECCQTFCRLSTVAIWLLWFFRICQWPLTPLTTQSFFSVCTLSIIWTIALWNYQLGIVLITQLNRKSWSLFTMTWHRIHPWPLLYSYRHS